MSTDCEQWRRFKWQVDAKWDVSARATNDLRRAIHQCGNRIVAALQDFAIMQNESIGNVPESVPCFVVINRDRLLA
jgi:hypothetical protein